jgi:type II secretory pathway component GspD/PulD (secretin)
MEVHVRSVVIGIALVLIGLAVGMVAHADSDIKFNYENSVDISDVIHDYAKASGTKWIIDPVVRGRITLFNPQKIPLEEAFNQLSSAMAINGLAYTEDEGTYKVGQARSIQRSSIPVVKEVPPLKPERMVTWVVTLKNISAEQMMREVRLMSSKDGECAALESTNQIVFTDYTSSLNKIAKVIAELDQPVDADRAKIIASAKKSREQREAARAKANKGN